MLHRKASRFWAGISDWLLSYTIAAKMSPKFCGIFGMILKCHLWNVLIWLSFWKKHKILQSYLETVYNVFRGNLTVRNQHSGIKFFCFLFPFFFFFNQFSLDHSLYLILGGIYYLFIIYYYLFIIISLISKIIRKKELSLFLYVYSEKLFQAEANQEIAKGIFYVGNISL